ncbi:hydroxyacylglutathione hydrolase [Agarivorans sp. QJM3NY_29]|uniref:hydroxyacylglutathione hydrolase n=1 Tax=unclassified Agarivorans TaxID=2636026 RepID=UPI003D7D082B
MQIIHIPAFSDNYIWLIKEPNSDACTVVDPGDAEPVLQRLAEINGRLSNILITHHHHDHIGGVNQLLKHFPEAQVFAPNNAKYQFAHTIVTDAMTIHPTGLSQSFTVVELPGHTLDHVAYQCNQHIFVGDTLFSAGCGRLFEGSAEQMHHSLNKLKALDPQTLLYAAHEYTQANLQFALKVEPDNKRLITYQQEVSKQRQMGLPTLPTTLEQQLAINPFLRCEQTSISSAVSLAQMQALTNEVAVFTSLRSWKDRF